MRIIQLSRKSHLLSRIPLSNGQKHGNLNSQWEKAIAHDKMMHTLRQPRVCRVMDINSCRGRASDVTRIQCNRYSHQSNDRHKTSKQPWVGVLGCVMVACGVMYKVNEDSLKAKDVNKADTNECQVTNDKNTSKTISINTAIGISRDLAQRIKDETGSPGLSIAVSVNGDTLWSEGIGYSDVENRVPCSGDSVFRIASISKPITMAAVARLIESGDLDLDKPIQHYVPSFPEKTWNGEKVTITTRQLVSHLSGVRHYEKKYMKENNNNEKTAAKEPSKADQSKSSSKRDQSTAAAKLENKQNQSKVTDEMELEEYFIKHYFKTVEESLALFKDDPLVHKPGSTFLYTTHGWTLISAVVEGITKTPFEKHLRAMLKDLGMDCTYLDENDPIIYHRGRHYMKKKNGRLINTPYVDLSYKWAGGGLISNVQDILKFGNIMLYSYQATGKHSNKGENGLPGFLKPETMKMIFTPVDKAFNKNSTSGERYAMGWKVLPQKQDYGCCREQRLFVSHTGAAIGGSSVLLILPHESKELNSKGDNYKTIEKEGSACLPKGIVVAIIVNMTSVNLTKTAQDIAQVFEMVD